MRILLTTGISLPEGGGPAVFVPAFVHGMKKRGHDCEVVTYGDEKTIQQDYPLHIVSRAGGAVIRYARYAKTVFQIARRFKPDVIFTQGPVSEGFPTALAAMFLRKPLVLKVVGDYAWEQYQQMVAEPELLDVFVQQRHAGSVGTLEGLERWVAKQARLVITPSKYLKQIVESWGVDSNSVKVIYNSLEALPAPVTDDLAQRFNIVGKKIVLSIAGRCVPWKNIPFLFGVMARLPADRVLVVVGQGPELEKWKQQAEAMGLKERIVFTGNQTRAEVAAWCGLASCFVLPSLYEGLPHVVLEAVSQGLPTYVSEYGGNPETHELYPDMAQVVSVKDESAWVEVLTNIPVRHAPIDLSKSFDEMIAGYEASLQNNV